MKCVYPRKLNWERWSLGLLPDKCSHFFDNVLVLTTSFGWRKLRMCQRMSSIAQLCGAANILLFIQVCARALLGSTTNPDAECVKELGQVSPSTVCHGHRATLLMRQGTWVDFFFFFCRQRLTTTKKAYKMIGMA